MPPFDAMDYVGEGCFMRMNTKLSVFLAMCAMLILPACKGSQLIVEREVTTTPDPNVIIITVTPSGGTEVSTNPTVETTSEGGAITNASTPSTPVPSVSSVAATETPEAQTGATFVPTPTLSAFPTEVRAPLFIAQQNFEHGYMFWLEPRKVVWVLVETTPGNKNSGIWYVYQDTFADGEPEVDPNLTAPDGMYQPRRGFGKLWRNTPGLRDTLGWATTPEFGLNTNYVYQPGGTLDANGNYIPGPGKHFLTTLGKEIFAMSEPEPGSGQPGKWERVG
jgi:hypothetical protein